MPVSQAQVRLAHAVMEGKAQGSHMGKGFASEVVSKMHGKKMGMLPDHVKGTMLRETLKKRKKK